LNITGRKIVAVSPVRNEEKYLGTTIKSMVNQTVTPIEYVLVDDGSTDKTAAIIYEASQNHPWIRYIKRHDRGERKVGPGVVEAFYDGYRKILSGDYDYIIKIDGDLSFGPRYFETLLQKFEADEYLGAASGKLFLEIGDGRLVEERIGDESVFGGMLCLRRKCFEAIGGFFPQVMWDGIVFHRCRMEGWRTKSYSDSVLKIYHHRMMGSSHKSIFHGRVRWGWGQYFMGTHLLYIIAIGLYRMLERPYIFGGILIWIGYFKGWLKRAKQYNYNGFQKSLHAWQMERLKIGNRLEEIPPPKTD